MMSAIVIGQELRQFAGSGRVGGKKRRGLDWGRFVNGIHHRSVVSCDTRCNKLNQFSPDDASSRFNSSEDDFCDLC